MENQELIALLEKTRDLMVAVATGGPRIDEVNDEYRALYSSVDRAMQQRGVDHQNPFADLWDWYGRWSSGDLPSYRSRRQLLSELFTPMLDQVRALAAGRVPRFEEPTGWPRADSWSWVRCRSPTPRPARPSWMA